MQKKTTLQYIVFSTATFIVVFVSGFILAERTAFASLIINSWQGYRLTDGLVGYWSFDGADITSTTALDKSGNANTGTLSAQIPSIGKNGQSLTFNGSSDLVDLGAPASLNLSGVNKFTLSAWVYPTSAPQGVGVISEMYQTTQTSVQYEIGFGMNEAAGGSTYLKVGFFDGAWRLAADTVSATLNEWVFITGTWDGTTLSLYKNGIFLTSTTPGGSLPSGNYDKVVIGRRHDSSGSVNFFPGKIDETRIYNRALSAEEVQRLYLMGASLKTNVSRRSELNGGLVGYWTFDGKDMTPNVRDASGSGNHGGLQNQNPTTTTIGKIGQGINLDGTNDYVISSVNGTTWTQLALSLWVNPSGNTATQKGILQWSNALTDTTPFMLIARDTTNGLRLYLDNQYAATGILIPDNAWSHIAVTLNSTNLWTMYVNGVSVATYQDDASHYSQAKATSIYLGNGYNGYFAGGIDEARVYNRWLSADEVKRLYLMGASLKTNVSHRDILTEGLVGNWTFDGKDMTPNVRDASGSGNHGGLQNQNPTTTTIGKIGQGINLDGTNDCVDIPNITSSGSFTYSAWYNTSDNDQTGIIFGEDNGNSTGGPKIGVVTGKLFVRPISATDQSLSAPTINEWHHLVVTRNSADVVNLYIDNSGANTLFSGAAQSGTYLLDKIGCNGGDSSQPFKGKLDDVRIYDRALSAEEVQRLYLLGK